jgi:hypothetical protein
MAGQCSKVLGSTEQFHSMQSNLLYCSVEMCHAVQSSWCSAYRFHVVQSSMLKSRAISCNAELFRTVSYNADQFRAMQSTEQLMQCSSVSF